MIVSFRCSPEVKKRIDQLVQEGLYPDFSSFCAVAVENQLLLEDGQPTGRSERTPPRPQAQRSARDRVRMGRTEVRLGELSGPPPRATASAVAALAALSVDSRLPRELDLATVSSDPPFPLPDALADLFQPGQPVPVDRWLFGQYNRVLPSKVSIRALASIASSEGKESLVLESAAARIAEVAADFGEYLQELDRKFATHRDDSLATAFPEKGADGQKGRVRYQNQFVGHTVKGEQGGILVGLKLATIKVIKNKPHILPTQIGWRFALLDNPLLDGKPKEMDQKLSQIERDFLIQHIQASVPIEAFAYATTLNLISRGICSPDAMNAALAPLLSPTRVPAETKEFVNTQRSGVLGRMTDLGLVSQERDGRHVSRTLTGEGKRFLEKAGQLTFPPKN